MSYKVKPGTVEQAMKGSAGQQSREKTYATYKREISEGSDQPQTKKPCYQHRARSDKDTSKERSICEERGKREVEIREYVFSVSLRGVEITHCNFGKTQVEVWYVAKETHSENIEEDLRKEIEPHINPYTLKLVKKACLPTFKYTSPGQSTSLRRADSCIGAYVSLTDKNSGESKMHAVVAGHDKRPGDIIYLNQNPNQRIGEVKVAKEGLRNIPIVAGEWENVRSDSYDVGLVLLDEQQRGRHENSVTTNRFGRVNLASATATLFPEDLNDDQGVMLFNNRNTEGTVRYNNYNSQIPQKFGMIAITQQPDGIQQAVHGESESGILIAALEPYPECGENLVKAVGMLVGVEEFEAPESISLAVPIGRNLQELQEDDYCSNKEIEFA